MRFLSFGRALDAAARIARLKNALNAALRTADHVVISGDLTESGTAEQFEAFGQALEDGHVDRERLTLVPGNHDAYSSADAWTRALDGPLRRYRDASAAEPGKLIERGGLSILPLDVAFHQPVTRSAGLVTNDHASRAWQWIDGLSGAARLTALLTRFPEVHVMHGHLHRVIDRAIETVRTRVFGAPALVEDRNETPRVRLYEVRAGVVHSIGLAA